MSDCMRAAGTEVLHECDTVNPQCHLNRGYTVASGFYVGWTVLYNHKLKTELSVKAINETL